jgi:hypothetical protein
LSYHTVLRDVHTVEVELAFVGIYRLCILAVNLFDKWFKILF